MAGRNDIKAAKQLQKQLRRRLGLPQPTQAEQEIFVTDVARLRPKKRKKRGQKKK